MNKKYGESAFFFILGVALMIYSLINHFSLNTEWKLSPYLFPFLISFFIVALSVSLFLEKSADSQQKKKEFIDWKIIAKFLVSSLIFYFIMPLIGFIPASIIFLAFLFIFLGERSWWKIFLLSVTTSVIIYLIFHVFLHVMLP